MRRSFLLLRVFIIFLPREVQTVCNPSYSIRAPHCRQTHRRQGTQQQAKTKRDKTRSNETSLCTSESSAFAEVAADADPVESEAARRSADCLSPLLELAGGADVVDAELPGEDSPEAPPSPTALCCIKIWMCKVVEFPAEAASISTTWHKICRLVAPFLRVLRRALAKLSSSPLRTPCRSLIKHPHDADSLQIPTVVEWLHNHT